MAKQDYYATLGVAREAGSEDLKKAYRKLAMQYHPDRNPGDKKAEAKFKEINEAYDILKDDQKRAAYDRYGHAAFEQGGAGGHGGFDFSAGGGFGDIFDQMFGEFMGGRRGGAAGRNRAGNDIRQAVEVELTEAYTGTKASLRVPTRVVCDACTGTGSEDKNRAADTCATCRGAGKVRAQQGFFLIERTCPTCGGQGRVIRNPCKVCSGVGTVQRERTLQVAIPPGVEDGTRIGSLAKARPVGTAPRPAISMCTSRSGRIRSSSVMAQNIFMRVPLRMTQAALGGDVEVPAIDGAKAKVKIPPGTQTGDQFRLRGKGFSVLRSAVRGDMYIQVAVETPQNLTRRQHELLEEFEAEAEGHGKGSPESEGFFSKVKEFFEGGRS